MRGGTRLRHWRDVVCLVAEYPLAMLINRTVEITFLSSIIIVCHSCRLERNPFPSLGEVIHPGPYRMGKEDHLILTGVTDKGEILDEIQCRRFFDVAGTASAGVEPPAPLQAILEAAVKQRQQELLEEIATKNGQWFDSEMDKFDRWTEDRRTALKAELDELGQKIKETKKAAR